MYLQQLQLKQFRNYAEQTVDFCAPKTILVGDNAQGKSNVLEAIELLATLNSHRTHRDHELVQWGQAIAHIQGTVTRDAGPAELGMTFRQKARRTVAVNGQSLRRQLDGLGILNAVQFSSLDLDLVRGGPERRRAWLDGLLVQLEPVYAHVLQQYNRVLRQRNALLRAQAKRLRGEAVTGDRSTPLLPETDANTDNQALWDAQLAVAGARVIRRRSRALTLIAPHAQTWQQQMSNAQEMLQLTYCPNVPLPAEDAETKIPSQEIVQQAFLAAIRAKATAEYHQGTSLVGPHRDDISLEINGQPARQFGSQGQQRTVVLSLKLAELMTVESVIGEPPLLLLDDVLAELDLTRQDRLLSTIQDRFQTVITTTHLGAFDAGWRSGSQVLEVKEGALRSPSNRP
ncbi:MAG: DNA replication/repair protein RecF [Cyanobacteria bacterium P01_C01_bin.89]